MTYNYDRGVQASAQHEIDSLPLGTLIQWQPKPPFGPSVHAIRTKDGWHLVKGLTQFRGLERGEVQATKINSNEIAPFYEQAKSEQASFGINEETAIQSGGRVQHSITLNALPQGSIIEHKGYQGTDGGARRYKKVGHGWVEDGGSENHISDTTLFEGMFGVHPGLVVVKIG